MTHFCAPPTYRLVSFTAAAAMCALCLGCGPTYRVYNGGTVAAESERPAGAGLKPSEADVRFSSDFADSSRNVAYGGPTNRVHTDIPETREPFFAAICVSTSVKGVVMLEPTVASTTVAHAHARSDTAEMATVADSGATGAVSDPSQQALVKHANSVGGQIYFSRKVDVEDVRASQAAQDAMAAADRSQPAHLQGLGDSDALSQSRKAAHAADTVTAKGPSSLGATQRADTRASSGAGAARQDSAVVNEQAGSDASQELSSPGFAVATLDAEAPKARRTFMGSAVRGESVAPNAAADTMTVDYTSESAATADIGDQSFIMDVTNAAAPVAHKRRHAKVTLAGSTVAAAATVGGIPAARQAPANVQGLGVPGAVGEYQAPANAADVQSARSLSSRRIVSPARQSSWVRSLTSLTRVSSPRISVLKQERLVRGGDIDGLLAKGILKEKPKSIAIVCYRIFLRGESASDAKDVTVTDRLDANLKLLEASVFTSDDNASAAYDESTRTLTVTFPRIEGDGARVIEFYAEPARE